MGVGSPGLLARFGTHRAIWRVRATTRSVRYGVLGRIFGARFLARDAALNASAGRVLVRDTLGLLVLGAAVVALCAVLEASAASLVNRLGLGAPSKDAYDILLQTVAGTTGVFLALYFTALSAVASAVYSTVPHRIRSLVIRDRLGNVYVRIVAFTMALSVALLVVRSFADTHIYLVAVPIIGLLAIFSIFAFIRLGQRAFDLADPTLLVGAVAEDLDRWLERARVGGWRWNDAAFQSHYRRQAAGDVSALVSLLQIAQGRPHLRTSSFQVLSGRIGVILRQYIQKRQQIPTQSKWFGERYQQKQWYLADGTELDAATQLGGALAPKVVPDVYWVERDLLDGLLPHFSESLKSGHVVDAISTVNVAGQVIEALGRDWSVAEGIRQLSRFSDRVLTDLDTAAVDSTRPELVPALLDAVAFAVLELELGFHRALDGLDIDGLARQIGDTDWTDESAPYELGLPRRVVGQLETLRGARQFEEAAKVEVTAKTPGWYVRELAFNQLEWELYEQSNALVLHIVEWCVSAADRLSELGAHDAAAAVLSRAVEISWKLHRHIEDWKGVVGQIRSFPLRLDVVRPEWDWEAMHSKVESFETETSERLSKLIVYLMTTERLDQVPDYLGEAVHRSGEACVRALAGQNTSLFAKLFPPYFFGILAIVDRIREQATGWQPMTAATSMSEPLIDAIDVSGYALVYSELHEDATAWEKCKEVWNSYLEGNDRGAKVTIIAAMYTHSRHLFALTPRSTMRTRWQMNLADRLGQIPRTEPEGWVGRGEVRHSSQLIREIAPWDDLGFMHYDVGDVFVARFLASLPESKGVEFGLRGDVLDRFGPDVPGEEGSK